MRGQLGVGVRVRVRCGVAGVVWRGRCGVVWQLRCAPGRDRLIGPMRSGRKRPDYAGSKSALFHQLRDAHTGVVWQAWRGVAGVVWQAWRGVAGVAWQSVKPSQVK